MQSLKNILFK